MDEPGRQVAPHLEPQLTLSALTLRDVPFEERVAAAAGAGFAGVGVSVEQYRRARSAGWTDAAMADLMEAHGVRPAEVEQLRHWARPPGGAGGNGADGADAEVFRLASVFGVPRVHAGMFEEHPYPDLLRGYRAACARAEEAGAALALEFMPFSAVATLDLAVRLVAEAGSPAAGLVLDTWHLVRARTPHAELSALDPAAVLDVQLADTRPEPEPDLKDEARHRRVLPGEGAGDPAGLLRLLGGAGVHGPFSVEVPSDALDALPPADAAARVHRACADVLAAASGTAPPW